MKQILLSILIVGLINCNESKSVDYSITSNENVNFEIYKTTAKSGLILRELPKRDSKKIATLDYDIFIKVFKTPHSKNETIEGVSGYWLNAEYLRMNGYVFSGYLSKLNEFETQLFARDTEELIESARNIEKTKTEEAMNLYYYIYRRSYFETNSPYCIDENCVNACEKYIQIKDCRNNPEKLNISTRNDFIEIIKLAIKEKNKRKLLEISNDCLSAVPICFFCDGGGLTTVNAKIDKIFENHSKIDFDTLNITENKITLEAKKPYKSKAIEYGNDTALPFIKIEFNKFEKGYLIEFLDGEVTYSSVQCFRGS
ncbi:SH3 domain-containing protein [Leptospira ognonensis]|uniref:SH3 domain-containing protein n=1 Tax=Leptospira ognonensis TaxID=2484945 RepID=A0A4R9KCE9_9LEPT|nr:SH3 domain-containing protein [Leptospira ognonensis]TGL63766.1 SH3 domain-containing protein [Leptospira ognonensis]